MTEAEHGWEECRVLAFLLLGGYLLVIHWKGVGQCYVENQTESQSHIKILNAQFHGCSLSAPPPPSPHREYRFGSPKAWKEAKTGSQREIELLALTGGTSFTEIC